MLYVLDTEGASLSAFTAKDDLCYKPYDERESYKLPMTYDDSTQAAMCSVYSLHSDPTNGVFFISVYATGIFDSDDLDGRYMFRWYNNSYFSEVLGVIAIGKLSLPTE